MTATAIAPKVTEYKLPVDPGKNIKVPDPYDVPAARDIPAAKPETDSFGKIEGGAKLTGASKPEGSMDAAPIFGGSHPVKSKASPAPEKKALPDSKYYDGPIRS